MWRWPCARVLLVDEWIETGAQGQAAIRLIEAQGGEIAGIACLHMDDNERPEWLRPLVVVRAVLNP